jgi:plasma-membrane proton-efflux P-type ATPase
MKKPSNKSKGNSPSSLLNSKNMSTITTSSITEILDTLEVNPKIGLTSEAVESRHKQYGYNEVSEKKGHPFFSFLIKFWGVSAWMLELIIILSAVLGKYGDLAVVSALLIVNAVLSFSQEKRAEGVIDKLRQRLQVNSRVLRNSSWQIIPARELVPGDIIRIRQGDIVPADIKLIEGNLSVDQSALTGESVDVNKETGDILSSGSTVRRGEGDSVVVLTGAETYFGRTTELVQLARPKLHIEEVVSKVVRWLFVIVGTLLILVTAVSLIRGEQLIVIIPLMLVLLMSAVPVALPVMFTVSLAVGSSELAKRGVLVTRLSAAEDAATMDVLCVDKTGTITINQLVIKDVFPLEGFTEFEVLTAGLFASQEANQDPIDLAFIRTSKERHIIDNIPRIKQISFTPFDAQNRRTEAIIEQDGQCHRVMKGAVKTIAEVCEYQPIKIKELEVIVNKSAKKGLRTLAVARGLEKGVVKMIGLVTLYDPPRPDALQLINKLHNMGVSVKMLTGDALQIAREIGKSVGLLNMVRVSDITKSDNHGNSQSSSLLENADGLAEVYPEDKYNVIQNLQSAGHIVGMTGDGVNDAPALHQAEVGIAVSTATDVAKGAASVVLTESGLVNIIALVEQGRMIYQRILTWILNKISRTILKSAFVAIAYLFTGKFVVSAFAMLVLVFLTDFAKITLATDEVRPSSRPETWKVGRFIVVPVVLGIMMVLEALLLLYFFWNRYNLSLNENALYSFSFLTLLYLAVFSILSARERNHFWSTMPSKPLIFALLIDLFIGTSLVLFSLPGLMPLPWWQILMIFIYSIVACLLVNDTIKVLLINWHDPFKIDKD